VADLGCGNGKYFANAQKGNSDGGRGNHIQVFGCDGCMRLLEIASKHERQFESGGQAAQCAAADVVSIPFRSNVFDYSISIAVRVSE